MDFISNISGVSFEWYDSVLIKLFELVFCRESKSKANQNTAGVVLKYLSFFDMCWLVVSLALCILLNVYKLFSKVYSTYKT